MGDTGFCVERALTCRASLLHKQHKQHCKECDLTVLHGTRHPDWTHNSEYSSRPVGGEVRAELHSRDVAHESRSAAAEALAWASVHGGALNPYFRARRLGGGVCVG